MAIDPNNLAATAKLTFSDEFNSLSLWNGTSGTWGTQWFWDDLNGGWATSNGGTNANNDLEWYINANYSGTAAIDPWTVSNGVLSITADRATPGTQQQIDGYAYTSGQMMSWHSFVQQYGYFEVSAKVPVGQGLWPAFWLLQQDGDWPPEIDVLEVTGNNVSLFYTSVHSNQTGQPSIVSNAHNVPDLSAAFHRYGVDWQRDYVTFYFDGQKVAQYATPADMNEPMYLLLNLAVGGSFPGNPNSATPFPSSYQVDYVRAYVDASVTALNGTTGGDTIIGGSANEMISGVDGSDYLRGGDGDDFIFGGDGFDDVHGNTGNDTERGGTGPDWVVGGQGDDLLYGEWGDDIVYGNLGSDTAYGGDGADIVRGGQQDDILYGGDGDDWLSGDKGSDTLTGGAGADVFHGSADTGVERILDFSRGQGDRIMLDPGTTYSVAQSGADTVITLQGGAAQMILVNVSMSTLTGDWIFGG